MLFVSVVLGRRLYFRRGQVVQDVAHPWRQGGEEDNAVLAWHYCYQHSATWTSSCPSCTWAWPGWPKQWASRGPSLSLLGTSLVASLYAARQSQDYHWCTQGNHTGMATVVYFVLLVSYGEYYCCLMSKMLKHSFEQGILCSVLVWSHCLSIDWCNCGCLYLSYFLYAVFFAVGFYCVHVHQALETPIELPMGKIQMAQLWWNIYLYQINVYLCADILMSICAKACCSDLHMLLT